MFLSICFLFLFSIFYLGSFSLSMNTKLYFIKLKDLSTFISPLFSFKIICFDAQSLFEVVKRHTAYKSTKQVLYYYNFDGFSIDPAGRFGNNFIQFMKVLTLSKIFHYRFIAIPYNFLLLKNTFVAGNITIQIKKNITKLLRGTFFYVPIKIDYTLINLFRSEFLKNIPNVSFDEDSLCIHIRSGDIFGNRPHPFYAQPPLNYYLDILKMRKWKNVTLIAEDTKNPVIPKLIEKGLHIRKNTFINDLSYLIYSYNLAIGFGTFGPAIAHLAPHIKLLFIFRSVGVEIYPHYDCFPDDLYVNNLIGKWKNTAYQRQLLLISYCKNWTFRNFTS